jgi:hypothetical protein
MRRCAASAAPGEPRWTRLHHDRVTQRRRTSAPGAPVRPGAGRPRCPAEHRSEGTGCSAELQHPSRAGSVAGRGALGVTRPCRAPYDRRCCRPPPSGRALGVDERRGPPPESYRTASALAHSRFGRRPEGAARRRDAPRRSGRPRRVQSRRSPFLMPCPSRAPSRTASSDHPSRSQPHHCIAWMLLVPRDQHQGLSSPREGRSGRVATARDSGRNSDRETCKPSTTPSLECSKRAAPSSSSPRTKVQAAELLGSQPDRGDAQEAAAPCPSVAERLRR